ncbi:MAG: U32 family peptidase, partial [Odoribacter sp.]|nr:U32 family peptidase [Odoribacter sp.]
MRKVELLSPARDLAIGMAAVNNGADAVYIGAPAFGARKAAANSLEDIASLTAYAHRFYCRVFVTLNTLLFDHELAEAERMIWQLYEVGVDALIVQDLGILRMNLPPICLHASTQMHNYDLERIKFLDRMGFQRIVLARELSLEQIRRIRKEVKAELEVFINGALCVSLSGQCYLSQELF